MRHVELSRHSTPQLAVQMNVQVEPLSQIALELAPIVTLHIAEFEQSYDALTPARTTQLAMLQLELELSPVVTLHVAPIEHATLQDWPHAPEQLDPALQLTCWLGMFGIEHAKPVAQVRTPGLVIMQPGPGHALVVRPASPVCVTTVEFELQPAASATSETATHEIANLD